MMRDELVIQPPGRLTWVDWPDVWRHRELLAFLVWRDIAIRYRQTVLGVAWAVIQPVMTMVVFTLFFGRLAGLDARTGGIPYPIYVFAGLLPWTLFSSSVTTSSGSVVGSANLIGKVFFPRIVIPLASIGASLIDFTIAFVVFLGLMAYYGVSPSWPTLLLPVLLAATLLLSAGVGATLAAVNVAYRDVRYVIPFVIQIWMFVSGVMYPPNIVPERWKALFFLNPVAGLIEGFRQALLGAAIEWLAIGLACGISTAVFIAGTWYFVSAERRFADII
jgi:lipopolysaccharide transport system permease protein